METHENRALVRRWFEEVWNKGREEVIHEMCPPDLIIHGLPGEEDQLRGPAAFLPVWHTFRNAFPDIQIAVDEVLCEGDMAAARCTVTGTHQGAGLGFAPTGRPVRFTGMCMMRLYDGKIAEVWNNFDFQAMNRTLGVR